MSARGHHDGRSRIQYEGFAAGTAQRDVPADWCCPDCGVREKADFVPIDSDRTGAS